MCFFLCLYRFQVVGLVTTLRVELVIIQLNREFIQYLKSGRL